MHLRNIFAGIVFSIALLGFFPGVADAQTCEDIGGSCRPGWISGCADPETPRTELCPLHTSGLLVCCKA
ncbi:MAG: hypothetical protein WAT81_04725, partial [Candidatus Moraniibacteriota bacterium]